jgi:outer membrane protein assembly factor BamB
VGDEPDLGPVLTDGRRLLVRGRDASGALRLTAYDLDDGDRIWQSAVPGGGQTVSVLGGRLVSTDRRLDGGRAGVLRFLG